MPVPPDGSLPPRTDDPKDFDATSADVFDQAGSAAGSSGSLSAGSSGGATFLCPDREQLELFAVGAQGLDDVGDHTTRCPVCREVVRRLRADNELLRDFVDANRDRFRSVAGAEPRIPGSIDVVPGFRVEGEIHRGAQGVVYRAEQLSTRRKVALKTLLQGKLATTRQRARFDREVEVVASLRHPNIVMLFESGRTGDGLAFFAMELVNGRPLSEVLKDSERLPLERMLRMFLAICKAIAYAHQRGVIHRDLKPANILIDEHLDPHVLDFGLARTARGEGTDEMIEATVAGEFLGTFAYAAPEQLRGNPDLIDVRTDVFALGVILYEILAGERPYKPPTGTFSITDLLLARIECDPPAPSTIRRCTSDLDIIALTCLKCSADERYQSAQALAEDLERYLDQRPILARPDSIPYVMRKWVRRHRVATATTVFIGLMIAAAVGWIVVQKQLEQIRQRKRLASFREPFQSINPETGEGSLDMRVLDWLNLIEENAKVPSDVDPVVTANLLNTVEAIRLGFEGENRPIQRLHDVVEFCKASAAESGETETPEIAEALHNLARGHLKNKELDEAEHWYRESLAMRERLHGKDAPEAAMTMQHLASCLRSKRDFPASSALLVRTLKVQEKARGLDSVEVAAVLNAQARLLEDQQDLGGALKLFETALTKVEKATKPGDYRIGRSHLSVGRVKRKLGRPADALPDLRIALDVIRVKKGLLTPEMIDAQMEFARATAAAGSNPRDAVEELRIAIESLSSTELKALREAGVVDEAAKLMSALSGDVGGP